MRILGFGLACLVLFGNAVPQLTAAPLVAAQGPPVITGFTPARMGAGGTITIQGTNFVGFTAVMFQGPAAGVSALLNSNGTIRVNVPDGAVSGPIRVITPAGTATSATPFERILPPVITSVTPLEGLAGSTFTIKGSNFQGVTNVYLDGGGDNRFSQPFTVSADGTTITAFDVAPLGTLTVSAVIADGLSPSSLLKFGDGEMDLDYGDYQHRSNGGRAFRDRARPVFPTQPRGWQASCPDSGQPLRTCFGRQHQSDASRLHRRVRPVEGTLCAAVYRRSHSGWSG